MTHLEVGDNIKGLREHLCWAQTKVVNSIGPSEWKSDVSKTLQRLINECDKHRPLGINGKHGNLHTETCGCEDKGPMNEWGIKEPYSGLIHLKLHFSDRSACGAPCPYAYFAGVPDSVTCPGCKSLLEQGKR